MDVADRLRLGDREDIDEILEVARVVGELPAPKVPVRELQGMDHCAHGAVEKQNPPG